jgi:hypothetical protein
MIGSDRALPGGDLIGEGVSFERAAACAHSLSVQSSLLNCTYLGVTRPSEGSRGRRRIFPTSRRGDVRIGL